MFVQVHPLRRIATTSAVCALLLGIAAPQFAAAQSANTLELQRLSNVYRQQLNDARPPRYYSMIQSPDVAQQIINETEGIELMYFRPNGTPVYFREDNLNAAKTVRTYDVWPLPMGGGAYAADGSTTAPGNLAVWDGAGVLLTHQEFGGRVTQVDGPLADGQHATHVAGTLIAAGVVGAARGMSYAAPLDAYNWTLDTSEMANAAANGLQVSNHSYGFATGWELVSGTWYWYGDLGVSSAEDYGFGFYDSSARTYDQIAYNAPDYLICVSAGNDRSDLGPGAGGPHYHWNNGWQASNDTHGGDNQNGGYDTISWTATAKNILTVGAINDITAGYSSTSDVVQTSFSSWGPCDDGRIKPDIVANGANLTSCNNLSDTGYIGLSGTSMSSPNAAGSVNLVAQEFEIVHATVPLSSTLKAIVINAADDAGVNPGPDYQNGWGLLNTKRSLDIVHAGPGDDLGVIEGALTDGGSDEYYFACTTSQDIRVTLCWTDPAGSASPVSLDPSGPRLVNDLDLVLENLQLATTVEPWNLSRTLPGNAATQGPNHVDNVEGIDLPAAGLGGYKVTVSHTGSLTGSPQAYSLVFRGMHEAPTPVQRNARVPSFWIGDPRPNPVAGLATIDFGLNREDVVAINVYDVAGRRVATLLNRGSRAAGSGTVTFDTSALASGVYFVRMESAGQATSRKITVVK